MTALTEIVDITSNGVMLSFCKAEDAAEYDINPDKTLQDIPAPWAKFSIKDSEDTIWVLGASPTMKELATFLWGPVYASRIDFNLPDKLKGHDYQCIVGWNYNGTDRYGTALTGQKLMLDYRKKVRPFFV